MREPEFCKVRQSMIEVANDLWGNAEDAEGAERDAAGGGVEEAVSAHVGQIG